MPSAERYPQPASSGLGAKPQISFGIIVLNGEPFTRFQLQALYPFAHQIIIVEGAAPAARAIASPTGHSTDQTLAVIRDFAEHCDPDHKITLVTAESEGHADGFWPGEKDEQSQAYAKRATGDYLWQIDIDEFYQPDDMQRVLGMLQADPTITTVSFKQTTFWGGFDYCADGWYLYRIHTQTHRVFKWGPGYTYSNHRPPTIRDEQGRDLRSVNWIEADNPALRDIFFYHYSLVFPNQVTDKSKYYGRADWACLQQEERWARDVFFGLKRPYRVHNVYDYPSWLNRFSGQHPPAIEQLRADITASRLDMALRQTDDIERLLQSRSYQVGRVVLQHTSRLTGLWTVVLLWRARLASLRRNPRRAFGRLFKRLTGQPI